MMASIKYLELKVPQNGLLQRHLYKLLDITNLQKNLMSGVKVCCCCWNVVAIIKTYYPDYAGFGVIIFFLERGSFPL